jgi:hypothetical protein
MTGCRGPGRLGPGRWGLGRLCVVPRPPCHPSNRAGPPAGAPLEDSPHPTPETLVHATTATGSPLILSPLERRGGGGGGNGGGAMLGAPSLGLGG